MRPGLTVVLVLAGALGLWRFAHSGAPSPQQLEPMVRAWLEAECTGTLDIRQLDGIRVGEYSEQMGGWPVFANHIEACVTHDRSLPYQNRTQVIHQNGQDSDQAVAVAFARRTASGRIELYTPEIFKQGEREMQHALDHAFDNVKVSN